MMGKKNKMKLVSNLKTSQQNSYNTIQANDETLPSAGLPKNMNRLKGSVQQPIKKLGSFMKKSSY